MEYLKNYYENYDEDSRLALPHGQVEFLTTMHYIEKYLRPGARIAEIGAGTGRYSHALAQRGYNVDAVELIQHNIDIFKEKTLPGEPVTVRQGNATDLSCFADETYDITLLLGPMYHLYTEEDQRKALSEALRITKKGGVVFAAYCCNDATMFQFVFGKLQITEEKYRALIDPVTFKAHTPPEELFVLMRKEDIDALMQDFAAQRLHYVGTDINARYLRAVLDGMDEETFATYMRYNLYICERPDMVGLTNHILDVFRRL